MSKTMSIKKTKKNRHRSKNNSSKKSKKIKINQRGGAAPADQEDAENRIKNCLTALKDTGGIVCSYIYHDGIHDTLASPTCSDTCNDSAYAIFNEYDDINNSLLSQGGQFYAVDKTTYYDKVKKGSDGFRKYSIRIAGESDEKTQAENIGVITPDGEEKKLSDIFPNAEGMASILDAGDHKYFPFPCSLSNIFDSASVGKAPTNDSKRHYHAANTADFADVIQLALGNLSSLGGDIDKTLGHTQACLALTLSIVLNCFSAAYLNYNGIIDGYYTKDNLCASSPNKKTQVLGTPPNLTPKKAEGICAQSGGSRSTQHGGAGAAAPIDYKNRFVLPALYFLANFTVTNIDKKCNATGVFQAGGGGAPINVLALVEGIADDNDKIENPFSGVKIFKDNDDVGEDMNGRIILQNPTLINISQSQMAAHINKICPGRADERSDKGANSPIIREFFNYLVAIGVDLNYTFIYVETMARLLKALGDRGHLTLAIMYSSLLQKDSVILTGDRLLNAASIKSIDLIKNQVIKSKISISINNRKVLQELVQYSDLLKQIAVLNVDMSNLNICFLYRSVEPHIEVKNSAKALFNLLYPEGRSDFMNELITAGLSVLQVKCILRMYIILKNNTVIHTDNRPELFTDDDIPGEFYDDVPEAYKSGDEYKVFAYAMLKSFEKYNTEMVVEGEAEADEFTDPTKLVEGLTLPDELQGEDTLLDKFVSLIDSQIETAKQLLRIETIETQIDLLNKAFGTDDERKKLLNQAFLGYKIGLSEAYTKLSEGPNWRYTPPVDPIVGLETNADKSIFNSEHTISRASTRFESSFIKLESDCGNTYYVNKSFSKISTIVDLLYSIVMDIAKEEKEALEAYFIAIGVSIEIAAAAAVAAKAVEVDEPQKVVEAAAAAAEAEAEAEAVEVEEPVPFRWPPGSPQEVMHAVAAESAEAERVAADDEAQRLAAEEENKIKVLKIHLNKVGVLKRRIREILLERQDDTLEFMSVLVIAYNTFLEEGEDVSRILFKGGIVMELSSDKEQEKDQLISKFSKFFNQIKEILGILKEYPIGRLDIALIGGAALSGNKLHEGVIEGAVSIEDHDTYFQSQAALKEEVKNKKFFIPKLPKYLLHAQLQKNLPRLPKILEPSIILKHLATEILPSIPIDMLISLRGVTADALTKLKDAYLDQHIPTVESTESSEKYESIQKEELADLRHFVMILFYEFLHKIYGLHILRDPNNIEILFEVLASVLDKNNLLQKLSILSHMLEFKEIKNIFFFNGALNSDFLSNFIFDKLILSNNAGGAKSDFQTINKIRDEILKHYFESDEDGSFKYPTTHQELVSILTNKNERPRKYSFFFENEKVKIIEDTFKQTLREFSDRDWQDTLTKFLSEINLERTGEDDRKRVSRTQLVPSGPNHNTAFRRASPGVIGKRNLRTVRRKTTEPVPESRKRVARRPPEDNTGALQEAEDNRKRTPEEISGRNPKRTKGSSKKSPVLRTGNLYRGPGPRVTNYSSFYRGPGQGFTTFSSTNFGRGPGGRGHPNFFVGGYLKSKNLRQSKLKSKKNKKNKKNRTKTRKRNRKFKNKKI